MDDVYIITSSSAPVPFSNAVSTVSLLGSTAVLSVPGIGLSSYNVNDQTTLSAIPLGPSFLPSTRTVSLPSPSSSSSKTRTTFVAVRKGAQGGELKRWTEALRKDGSVEGDADPLSVPLDEALADISAISSLPTHLLLLSNDSKLSLVSSETLAGSSSSLSLATGSSLAKGKGKILGMRKVTAHDAWVLPPGFLPAEEGGAAFHLAVVALPLAADQKTVALVDASKKAPTKKAKRVSSASLMDTTEVEPSSSAASTSAAGTSEGSFQLSFVLVDGAAGRLAHLASISIAGTVPSLSPNGTLNVLTPSRARIETFALDVAFTRPIGVEDAFSASGTVGKISTERQASLCLRGLENLVLLGLSDTLVLVAGVPPTAPLSGPDAGNKVQLQLWDVQLRVLLASQAVAIPSSVVAPGSSDSSSFTPSSVGISLFPLGARGQGAAVLLQPANPAPGQGGRAVLFGLPIREQQGSLAAALGRGRESERWLVPAVAAAPASAPALQPAVKTPRQVFESTSKTAREALLDKVGDTEGGAQLDSLILSFFETEGRRAATFAASSRSKKGRKKGKSAAVPGSSEPAPVAAAAEDEPKKGKRSKERAAFDRIEAVLAAAPKETDWEKLLGERIKGVSDVYRISYVRKRKDREEKGDKPEVDQAADGVKKSKKRREKKKKSRDGDVEDAMDEDPMDVVDQLQAEPVLPRQFLSSLLSLCFSATPPSRLVADYMTAQPASYPSQTTDYLLERGLITEAVLEGGLLFRLLAAHDWERLCLALSTLPDISEEKAVFVLKVAVHLATRAKGGETDEEVPLADITKAFLKGAYTPSELKSALQRGLEPSEVLPLLNLADIWLEDALEKNEYAAFAELPTADADEVRLEQLVPFLQIVLDSHFIPLLLQRQSHALLARLSTNVARYSDALQALTPLLSALSIFSRAKEDEERRKVREAEKRRLLAANPRTAAQSGKTDLTDIWENEGAKVREKFKTEMERRAKAQDIHMRVGAYAVETFYL